MARRQGKIIPNAKIKNRLLVCSYVISWPTYAFKAKRIASSPNKMTINNFDRFRKTSFPLTSNFDVLINRMEKIQPIKNASNTSDHGKRNCGTTNIRNPVAIKNGGKIIFFAFVGLLEALTLIKITNNAIITANMELTTTTGVHPSLQQKYYLTLEALKAAI